MSNAFRLFVVLSILVGATPAWALEYTLVSGLPGLRNHYPGADGRVGTADDTVSGQVTSILSLTPNYRGDLGYSALTLGGPADPALPAGHNFINFLSGSLTLDLPSGGSLSPGDFQLAVTTTTRHGRGDGFLQLNVLSGTYSNGTRQISGVFDVLVTANGVTMDFADASMSGDIMFVDAPFAATGSAYVDNVLIPLAQSRNADSMVIVNLEDTNPFVPSQLYVVAFNGEPTAQAADLVLAMMPVSASVTAPGDTVTYAASIQNLGPGMATEVELIDVLTDGFSYVGNTCGLPPPQSGVLTWSIGNMNAGEQWACDLQLQIDFVANADLNNAATVFASQGDPNLLNNAARGFTQVRDSRDNSLNQASDGVTGFQSDLSCDACANGAQSMFANFRLNEPAQISSITVIGGYSANVPFNDEFQVEFYTSEPGSNAPGIGDAPVRLIARVPTVPVIRTPSGSTVAGGFTGHQYELDVVRSLNAGSYWIAIFNNSSSTSNNDWFWGSGNADATGLTITGVASTPNLPFLSGVSVADGFELAISLEIAPEGIFEDDFGG